MGHRLKRQLPIAGILPEPPGATRQTGQPKTAAPHGRTLSSPSACPTRRHPDRLLGPSRAPIAPIPRVRAPVARPPRPPAAGGITPPSSRPCAAFRQRGGKSVAGSPRTAPRGRPAIGTSAWPSSVRPGRRAGGRRARDPAAVAAAAAGMKVVIVVGPVGSSTANYIYNAKKLRGAGPLLRRDRVRDLQPQRDVVAGQDRRPGRQRPHLPRPRQRLPEPVRRLPALHEGRAGPQRDATAANIKYYGEYYIETYIKLAPNAVVHPEPALLRLGQLRVGARQPDEVDRDPAGRQLRRRLPAGWRPGRLRRGRSTAPSYILSGLFKTTKTIKQIFFSDPARDRRCDFSFSSVRTPGKVGSLDPMDPTRTDYYRSVIGDLGMTADDLALTRDRSSGKARRRASAARMRSVPRARVLARRRPRSGSTAIVEPPGPRTSRRAVRRRSMDRDRSSRPAELGERRVRDDAERGQDEDEQQPSAGMTPSRSFSTTCECASIGRASFGTSAAIGRSLVSRSCGLVPSPAAAVGRRQRGRTIGRAGLDG